MPTAHLPRRSVHLDFHTSPLITPIAQEFDSEAFAERFAQLGVDSVTLFAKCHHGQLYYDTSREERHPGLGEVNLLRAQIEALRPLGIRTPIYLSVLFDEHAAAAHPEWVARDDNGAPTRVDSHGVPGWRILDMTSGYRSYLADQITDVLEHFPDADGFFFDICFDQPGFSASARAAAIASGFNPDHETGRRDAASAVSHDYMREFRDMVAGAGHDGVPRSVFFNSRPRLRLADELGYSTHDEIEALPTGGWGYAYAPSVARSVIPIQPRAIGMTGRFFGSWGDSASVHPAAALKYESLQMSALGLGICIGDSLPPSGRSHEAVTARLAETFAHVRRVQNRSDGAARVVEVAVMRAPASVEGDVIHADAPGPGELAALRLLTARGIDFDFVDADHDLSSYRAILVLAGVEFTDDLVQKLTLHVEAAGALVLSGLPDDLSAIRGLTGLSTRNDLAAFTREFVRPVPAETGLADFDYVLPGSVRRVRSDDDSVVLATVTEPYFDRTPERFSGHEYTPAGHATTHPAIVVRGRVASAAFELFETYGATAIPEIGDLAQAALAAVFPRPALHLDGPSHLEGTLQRHATASFVHLLSYLPSRRMLADVETVLDPVPARNVAVRVRLDGQKPRSVTPLDGEPLPFEVADGYVCFDASFDTGHCLIAIDLDIEEE